MFLIFLFLTLLSFSNPVGASSHMLEGTSLNLLWGLPFVGVLLSLAFLPLLRPHLWHSHYGKIILGWSILVFLPMGGYFGINVLLHEILITYGLHYFPFIVLAGSLFIIAGGIRMHIRAAGSPVSNSLILMIATLMASFIGTTGAAMLFIRPLLSNNEWRRRKRHTMIFFILLVCNIGGCLTALGDPPLFLGFLFGVDFFWPFFNLIGPFLVLSLPLLTLYFCFDWHYYKKEDFSTKPLIPATKKLVRIEGGINFLILAGVLASVLISGIWNPGIKIKVATVDFEVQNLARDFSIILLTLMSLCLADQTPRRLNKFTWEPLLEVVKIFAGIFITAAPVIVILNAGEKGALAPLIKLVTHGDGSPINNAYFWMTGALSAFLDNAPTYMIFFYMASGDPNLLTTTLNTTLIAISAGSVFMGAMTYIGNAPNFMIKSIAESNHIKMPSFFGYMLWSGLLLIPLFLFISWIYF